MQGNKIVLDLEFTPIRDPDLQAVARSEILEIGAVKLNEQNAVLEEFQTYVKPQYSRVLPRVTVLTGITEETVATAPSYAEAMANFTDWIGSDCRSRFYTWSNSDQNVILNEADLKAARYVLHSLGGLAATASENVWIYPPDEPDQCTGLYADLFRGNGTRGVGRCQEHGEDPEAAEQLAGRAGANPAIPHHL